jgi:hypothetical protein
MLGGTVFDRVSSINDLGVIMEEKMTFSEHVDVIVAKAFAMLGFIRSLSLEFRDPYVWNPFYDLRVDRVERVQRRFIRYASRGLDWTYMIYHRMRTDAPFCILTPLQKGDRLLVGCLFSMF